MAVTAAFLALAWLAVSVRLGVRYTLIKRRLWWDDGEFWRFPASLVQCRQRD